LYVAVTMVFPYVLAFYIVLSLLEDFGYLPRLAVLLDTLMHRMGLHGWAIIPMLLGLGCNVPGIMATRVLESERERWIAATLVSIAVPCASLQAMMWGILGHHSAWYVAAVFGVLFLVWIVLGWILNMMLKGMSPELILEIPPYRLPSPRAIAFKLWTRIQQYFKEAVPFVMLGVLLVNLLNRVHVFDVVARVFGPAITRLFGLPQEAVLALVLGFLRKDIAVGMLGSLNLTPKQMIVSVTVLAMSFPCIATFIVLARELGIRGLIKSMAVMAIASFTVGVLLNRVL
ncbi:MAG: ferrous iron transporter B, partial [Candidatus Hydrogenedentes bacterium]|nr:ferrous iron transporter B [Candidatus Hydrogenedentota bacterium]